MSAGSRRVGLGVADQVLSSGSNFAAAFVASVVLVPDEFGAFVVGFAVVTVLAAGARAFLSEPLIAHLPVVGSEQRRQLLASSALGDSLLLGLLGSLLLALGGIAGLPVLFAFVLWVPAAFVADAGRYVLLSRLDTARTLAVDAVWAGVQTLVLVGVGLFGTWSVVAVAAAWGIGAWAAVVALFVLGVERPGRPLAWLREGRYLSGWFTVVSVVGQVQLYAVLLLAGVVLAAGDMAGLRAVQLLVVQPPTTLMGAVLVLATPRFAVLAADPVALRRLQRVVVAAMLALALVILLAIPLRHVLLDLLFPRYTSFSALVAPLALQVAILGLGVPFAATLRGMRLGGRLCATQLVGASCLVAGAATGLVLGGVLGLAWGMACGAVVAVSVEIGAAMTARPRETMEVVSV